MKSNWAAGAAMALTLVALVWQVQDGSKRMAASRLLFRAEGISLEVMAAGTAPRAYLQQNLRDLRRAAELDPLEAAIPLALGSQFLLLDSPQAAQEAYRSALEIEPRPETYLNLGKAQFRSGQKEAAQENFERAVKLDWHFKSELPR